MSLMETVQAQSDVHKFINKAVDRSQHCQRNFDLTRDIPKKDIDQMVHAVTQCPSKQNGAFYEMHFVTNRDMIEEVHEHTTGFTTNLEPYEAETNSQVLGNLLVIFAEHDYIGEMRKEAEHGLHRIKGGQLGDNKHYRSDAEAMLAKTGQLPDDVKQELERDKNVAIGIAAGYLNLTCSLLGYRTGCCQCFDIDAVQSVAGLPTKPILLMGIGYNNPEMNRRRHQIRPDFMFPTKKKQEIKVAFWD